MSNKVLVVIAGPTAVGKTDVAIQIAQHFRTEIISADSRQVYREMNIGVGRPTPLQLNQVKHHLIGHISIHQRYTAALFAEEARQLMAKLFEHHDVIVIAGGTGLYIKALTEGLDAIPNVPDAIFEKWNMRWKESGTEYLSKELRSKDPVYSETVDHHNPMRLIRALSVIEATGQPFSDFLKGRTTSLPCQVLNVALELPRDILYERINARVIHMMEEGWLEEALTLYPDRSLKALQTVGYKELFDHIARNLNLDEAIAAIQQSTRRYAKRQLTWWRNQGDWWYTDPSNSIEIIARTEALLQTFEKDSRS